MNKTIGEMNLQVLLASMEPVLHKEEFVYCQEPPADQAAKLTPILRFKEAEAVTLIVTRKEAEKYHLEYQYPCRQITLKVHSSLAAIGFLAVITQRLAAKGISVNPVSAYYHDHLFVPADKAAEALEILQKLAEEHSDNKSS